LDDRHQRLDFTVILASEDEIQELCQHRAFMERMPGRRQLN
jgi:hypothetical protein